jgi:hypothetical protein
MSSMGLAVNPFCHQSPIRDRELFFGRQTGTKRVLDRLRKGQNVSVVGKSKIGKTSFLYHVSNPQVAVENRFSPQRRIFFYIDCRCLADLSRRDCLGLIKTVVEKTISTWQAGFLPAVESATSSGAYDWLDRAFSLLGREGIPSIVQFDDFDRLAANPRLSLVFLENLRALGEMHDTLAYLTASRVPLFELQGRIPRIAGSPFFNNFWQYELGPFDPKESRRFLAARLASVDAVFPEAIQGFISDLGRGEPYRLQLAGARAYALWCENADSLCEGHCEEIEKRFNDALRLASCREA